MKLDLHLERIFSHPIEKVQAAISAVHTEAVRFSDTDWLQIVGLFAALERMAPSPVVTLTGRSRCPMAGLWKTRLPC